MWCEMVGCDRLIRASISQAHMPDDFSSEQHPGSFSMLKIRRRVGSAMARSIAVKTSSPSLVAVRIFTNVNIHGNRWLSIFSSVQKLVHKALQTLEEALWP